MAGTYGMRAVPLGPSCDLVVAGKAGMDGLWSADRVYSILARKGLTKARHVSVAEEIHHYVVHEHE